MTHERVDQPPPMHEATLAAWYDRELDERVNRAVDAERVARRRAFVSMVVAEGRRSVLEVGAGAGRDAETLAAAGLDYVGVDLSARSVALGAERGRDVRRASILDLPFDDDTFEAGWTMSTLLHVAHDDLDRGLDDVARVLRPGAPLAIGTWGGPEDVEQWWDDGQERGPRFFSNRTDATLRRGLARIGTVEQFATWPGPSRHHYQWAVLRLADGR